MQQSGRVEEEIELLQHKLKQVEEGMAFSGKKTKMARSQGKKIQITVQKEYSRFVSSPLVSISIMNRLVLFVMTL